MYLYRTSIILFVLIGLAQVHGDSSVILNNVKLVIETAKSVKNIWDFVKDLPPTLGDYLTGLFSSENNDAAEKPRSSYDFVVDLTRPTDIFGKLKSYPLAFPQGKEVYDMKIRDNQKPISRFVVNVVGRYNTGKTLLLRLLANINLPHSFTERTNGLSVALPSLSETNNVPMALIDTAGTRTPVDYSDDSFKDRSYERQVGDSFIQEVAISSAEVFVCVVNQLTLDDQLYLKSLYNRLSETGLSPSEIKQRLLLVHNYFNLHTVDEVNKTTKHELENLFGATEQPQGFWLSKQFKHFVIAHTDSEAGKIYNDRSIVQIRTMIQGSAAAQNNDVLKTIINRTGVLLTKVLVEGAPVKAMNEVKNAEQSWFDSFGSFVSGIKARISPNNREKPMTVSEQRRVDVQLEIQSLTTDNGQTLWFICPETPLQENITLSKSLKFAEDGSVHVDFSSRFIPAVKITRLEDGNMQIAVECPSCENSYGIGIRSGSLIIRGEKSPNKIPNSKEYLNNHRFGQFEIEVPVNNMDKEYLHDLRKNAIKNVYQNGVILLTVMRQVDDDDL